MCSKERIYICAFCPFDEMCKQERLKLKGLMKYDKTATIRNHAEEGVERENEIQSLC